MRHAALMGVIFVAALGLTSCSNQPSALPNVAQPAPQGVAATPGVRGATSALSATPAADTLVAALPDATPGPATAVASVPLGTAMTTSCESAPSGPAGSLVCATSDRLEGARGTAIYYLAVRSGAGTNGSNATTMTSSAWPANPGDFATSGTVVAASQFSLSDPTLKTLAAPQTHVAFMVSSEQVASAHAPLCWLFGGGVLIGVADGAIAHNDNGSVRSVTCYAADPVPAGPLSKDVVNLGASSLAVGVTYTFLISD
jgi:hypothetical protein